MGNYNLTRFVEELLEEHQSDPPSFSVHLYPDYWTLNNGSKFLYNNQVAVCPMFSRLAVPDTHNYLVAARRHTSATDAQRLLRTIRCCEAAVL